MKAFFVLSLIALAWGQDLDFECQCGMFISTPVSELEVHRLPPRNLEACDINGYADCGLLCIGEWNFIFMNGGLEFTRPGSNQTMGEESCANLVRFHQMSNLEPTFVHNNYRFCSGPWTWDGEMSYDQKLCCVDGVYPGNC